MTMRAYSESYLSDAMSNLGGMLDFAVHGLGYGAEGFFDLFLASGLADEFGRGNPKYVAGMSGAELALEVLRAATDAHPWAEPETQLEAAAAVPLDRSEEYWAGWMIAWYQWYSGTGFRKLKRLGLTTERVLALYHPLHEADVTKFADVAQEITRAFDGETALAQIRKAHGLSQRQLADRSGVALRAIQLYEQRQNDLAKAQAGTLAALGAALAVSIEDLLD